MKNKFTIFFLLIFLSKTFFAQLVKDWAINPQNIEAYGSNIDVKDFKVDEFGNIFITGSFSAVADFDLTSGIYNVASPGMAGVSNIFFAKYNATGELLFVKNIGGENNEGAYAIELDSQGNIYIAGYLRGVTDFDPSEDYAFKSSNLAYSNLFIAKYNSFGDYIYVKTLGDVSSTVIGIDLEIDSGDNIYILGKTSTAYLIDLNPEQSVDNKLVDNFVVKLNATGDYLDSYAFPLIENCFIKLDHSDNLLIAGSLRDPFDFDFSNNSFVLNPLWMDVFFAKYSPDGNLLFAKCSYSWSDDYLFDAVFDENNNIIATGNLTGITDFDFGAGVANIESNFALDGFVVKYDSIGNFIFAQKIEGTGDEIPSSICLNQNNDIFIAGSFSGTVDLDPSLGVVNYVSTGSKDVFVVNYSSSGTFLNSFSIGGNGNESESKLMLDSLENVILLSSFYGSTDIDPGLGNFNVIAGGSFKNAFISKYSDTYAFTWGGAIGAYTNISRDEAPQCSIIDTEGSVYLTGYYKGSIDFDPTSNYQTITSNGGNDIFLAKYDSLGQLIFVKGFGGLSDDYGYGVSLDATGNLLVTGSFKGVVDFDPGMNSDSKISNGNDDIFVSKYDNNGNYLFTITIGGSGSDLGTSIESDINNNIIVTGEYSNTVDFNPGTASFNLFSNGLTDVFLSKFDSSGQFVFTNSLGGTLNDKGSDIVCDNNGNIYLTGYFQGSADFDPGPMVTTYTSNGSYDAFCVKYDSVGQFDTAFVFGGLLSDYLSKISIDSFGNILLSGSYTGTVDFDPGSAVVSKTAVGNTDCYFVKYDSSGQFVYVKTMGGNGYENISSHHVDIYGNVYITGYFNNVVDFDPNSGTVNLPSHGDYDTFLAKYDASGNYQYANSLGGTFFDNGCSIFELNNSIYLIGSFTNSMDIDLGGDMEFLKTYNSSDVFVIKYKQDCIPAGSPSISAITGFLCEPTSINLAVNSSSLNSASQWIWYTAACGGNYLGSGFTINVNPTSSTTYYARGEGGCGSSSVCDSIRIEFGLIPNSTISNSSSLVFCAGDTVILNGVSDSLFSYQWLYNTFDIINEVDSVLFASNPGDYSLMVTNNFGCSDTSSVINLVENGDCYVWPGDTGNNGYVTNYDLLPIGLFYGQTGPSRSIVSNTWQQHFSNDWGTNNSSTNLKHVDCNGDGVIDANDTLAINLNFSQTHSIVDLNNQQRVQNPNLMLNTPSNTYLSGDWVDLDIVLGGTIDHVYDLYGIGFNIEYDASFVEPGTAKLLYDTCWFATPGANSIKFAHIDEGMNIIYGSETKIDHLNSNGYGKIATFRFQLKSSILSNSSMYFSVISYSANDSSGAPLSFNLIPEQIVINPVATEINYKEEFANIGIYPNPFNENTQIIYELKDESKISIELFNALGQKIEVIENSIKQPGRHSAFVSPTSKCSDGVYFVKVTINDNTVMKKIIQIKL